MAGMIALGARLSRQKTAEGRKTAEGERRTARHFFCLSAEGKQTLLLNGGIVVPRAGLYRFIFSKCDMEISKKRKTGSRGVPVEEIFCFANRMEYRNPTTKDIKNEGNADECRKRISLPCAKRSVFGIL